MPQFSLHRNKAPSEVEFPFLLDIQNDLLNDLQTRVVIPLHRKGSTSLQAMARLMPEVSFAGQSYVLMTPQMAGIDRRDLGDEVGDLKEYRDEILGAIDLLVVGF